MRRSTILLGILVITLGCLQRAVRGDLKALYEAQRWPELYDTLGRTPGNDFYRGAVAVTFHQDAQRAESYLTSTITAAPKSDEAYQAYRWLSHLFLYTGQYQRAVAIMKARWAAFPEKTARAAEQEEFAAFRGAPDQIIEPRDSFVYRQRRDGRVSSGKRIDDGFLGNAFAAGGLKADKQNTGSRKRRVTREQGQTFAGEIIHMKAIAVTDQAAGTAGMALVERPEPQAAINDVVVQLHAPDSSRLSGRGTRPGPNPLTER